MNYSLAASIVTHQSTASALRVPIPVVFFVIAAPCVFFGATARADDPDRPVHQVLTERSPTLMLDQHGRPFRIVLLGARTAQHGRHSDAKFRLTVPMLDAIGRCLFGKFID